MFFESEKLALRIHRAVSLIQVKVGDLIALGDEDL